MFDDPLQAALNGNSYAYNQYQTVSLDPGLNTAGAPASGTPSNANTANEGAFSLSSLLGQGLDLAKAIIPAYYESRVAAANNPNLNAAKPNSLGNGGGMNTQSLLILGGIVVVAVLLLRRK